MTPKDDIRSARGQLGYGFGVDCVELDGYFNSEGFYFLVDLPETARYRGTLPGHFPLCCLV